MALWTNVELNDNGQVTPDDGQSSWQSTLIYFGWRGGHVMADMHRDGYSGKAMAAITHDDFGLPTPLLERLSISLFWSCGEVMRETCSDLGFAQIELERVVENLFYRSDAERMLRKFRSAAAPLLVNNHPVTVA